MGYTLVTQVEGHEYRYTEWADFNTPGHALKVKRQVAREHRRAQLTLPRDVENYMHSTPAPVVTSTRRA